jgi:hypothetical protein
MSNVIDLSNYRRKRLYKSCRRFYECLSIPQLTEHVIFFNNLLKDSSPSEDLYVKGVALFSFIADFAQGEELRHMAIEREDYCNHILQTQFGSDTVFSDA